MFKEENEVNLNRGSAVQDSPDPVVDFMQGMCLAFQQRIGWLRVVPTHREAQTGEKNENGKR